MASNADFEVTHEDQKLINRFSTVNMKHRDLEEQIGALKTELQHLRDASEEVMVCMEADGIMVKSGDTFWPCSDDSANDFISECQANTEKEIADKEAESEKLKEEIDGLKKKLYGRFGDKINLEA
eukprot:GDKI01026701.1.p1 GENE.GDKI01026701.1~~GDKI01026701.1.p1  ORF type:complete len:136 (-),score=45.36 GDKI01026701.1:337-711(-)